MKNKKITRVHRATGGHWVGDGFPVSTLFSYHTDAEAISPFLLLDYAGPASFAPADQPRGVEEHPHRGFETVTIVYQGEVEHSDNAGNSGKIGPGDVQWMTAARGILHEEMHGMDFTRRGGTLEMIQLWVNLPAAHKMDAPGYQELLATNMPQVNLPDGAGHIRVIAGAYDGVQGAAKTFTPVNLWDMHVKAGSRFDVTVPEGHNSFLLTLKGKAVVNGHETLSTKEMAHFTQEGETITVETAEDSILLLMSGTPIDEPVVGRGPFVMNTMKEISDAMTDYALGRF